MPLPDDSKRYAGVEIEKAETHVDKLLNWNKKKKAEMEAKRVEDERRQEQIELSMMQSKPKIKSYKGNNYKMANQLYIDNCKRNLDNKPVVHLKDKLEEDIYKSDAGTIVDPNKVVKGILNSIFKEVPLISKNNYLMNKRKEKLDK